MTETLTDLERRVLDYLVEYLRTNTYQPSIREIGRTFSIKSTKTVSELLQSLADKGWVERDPSRSRGVRLLGVELHTRAVSVPMQPALRSNDLYGVETLELDQRIASRSTFLVMMQDDALEPSCIKRGDMLLVEPVEPEHLEEGDIVLATVNGTPLVRRFNASPVARLESDDPKDRVIALGASSNVLIDGRVISVVRRLRAPAAVITPPAMQPIAAI
jgi:repressor LexA